MGGVYGGKDLWKRCFEFGVKERVVMMKQVSPSLGECNEKGMKENDSEADRRKQEADSKGN